MSRSKIFESVNMNGIENRNSECFKETPPRPKSKKSRRPPMGPQHSETISPNLQLIEMTKI